MEELLPVPVYRSPHLGPQSPHSPRIPGAMKELLPGLYLSQKSALHALKA